MQRLLLGATCTQDTAVLVQPHIELEMRFVMLTLRGVGLVGVESVEWAGLATGYVAIAEGTSPEGWFAVMLAATARR